MCIDLATAIRAIGLAGGLALSGTVASAQTVLLMAEEPGCVWCARWNADIGPIYDKSGYGVAAPLRRMNIQEPTPGDITLKRSVNFTPTFVLLIDGHETTRIEGYPGEDFFWGLLGETLTAHNIDYNIKTAAEPLQTE